MPSPTMIEAGSAPIPGTVKPDRPGRRFLQPEMNGLEVCTDERCSCRGAIALTTHSSTTIFECIRQGLGVTVLAEDIASVAPQLEKVMPSPRSIPIPIWFVTHRELQPSGKNRLVFDVLAEFSTVI